LPHGGCARRADLQLEVLRLVGAAWDARPDAPCAATELREWASYCGVCRAWRAHFAGRPLRLAFDAPLTRAQVPRRPSLRRPLGSAFGQRVRQMATGALAVLDDLHCLLACAQSVADHAVPACKVRRHICMFECG